jgi:hypothetical protein
VTQAEKLQQLFDAALKDPSELHKHPTRAFPTAGGSITPAVNPPGSTPEPRPAPVAKVSAPPVITARLPGEALVKQVEQLEKQQPPTASKVRYGTLLIFGLFLALTGAGFCWFVQSPQRIEAITEVIRPDRGAEPSGPKRQATETRTSNSNQGNAQAREPDAKATAAN